MHTFMRVGQPWGEAWRVNVPGARHFVNHLTAPDAQWLHRHPYEFCYGKILSGGYTHEYFDLGPDGVPGPRKTQAFRPGDVNFMLHNRFHRIAAVEPNTYSEFLCGPQVQGRMFLEFWTEWGVLTQSELERRL